MSYNRQPLPYRPEAERLQDWKEVHKAVPAPEREPLLHTQSARCMECGTPFCHQNATGAAPQASLQWMQLRQSAASFLDGLHGMSHMLLWPGCRPTRHTPVHPATSS